MLSDPDTYHGSSGIVWKRGPMIGAGSLGHVFKGLNQDNGCVFAVKEVLRDENTPESTQFKTALLNEVNLLKNLKHESIVSYLGSDEIGGHFYVYLEFMAGGSIAGVLQEFGPLDEDLVCCYTKDIVKGLHYLHTLSPPVLHRDVKCANILVSLECQVKLTDFGCSKKATGEQTLSQSMCGSIPWMAPEVITRSGYGRKADIWSFGCVLIEMATAAKPWGAFDNPMAAMVKIGMSNETPPLPRLLGDRLKDLILQCVRRDKALRPDSARLLAHDFISDAEELTVTDA
eukprot:NODE_15632_length_1039_cov_9.081140.p1 GENE.NODE_15632_length_1039_cov_9.081140~~NODE_15632_length_1039_cov_9.081140.p1  ORF type:complete len:314 (+),score=63.63 NODE_15632_length_1039_cov_9.081140:83-943(+)